MLDKFLNQIICGDAEETLKQLPDASIDLIITSPPYNLRNSTGGNKKGTSGKWKSNLLDNGYATYNDNLPHGEYVAWQRRVITECMRVLKSDGALFYNHKWRVQGGLLQDRQDIVSGFPVRQIIIWQRAGGLNFNRGYFVPTYEVIYMIAHKDFKLVRGASGLGDVWRINQVPGKGHPATFPLELPTRIIQSTTAQVILDPFVGSGTTCIAAKSLGRDYIGVDISADYCAIARKNLEG